MRYGESDFTNKIEGQGALGAVGYGPVPKEPPFSRLWSAIDLLRKAEAESSVVTDRLCGSVPDEEASKSTPAVGAGLFDGIMAAADAINEIASRISASASRVQRHL